MASKKGNALLRDTPHNWAEPDWYARGKVHDWRNYVSKEVRDMWFTFTEVQCQALARQAQKQADKEEWD